MSKIYVGKFRQNKNPSSAWNDHRWDFEPSAEAQIWLNVAKRADWHNQKAMDAYNQGQMVNRMRQKLARFKVSR